MGYAATDYTHTVRVQGVVDIAPSKTWSQRDVRFVRTNAEVVDSLQINENTTIVDAGKPGIRRVTAATNREFCLEKADNFESLGYL